MLTHDEQRKLTPAEREAFVDLFIRLMERPRRKRPNMMDEDYLDGDYSGAGKYMGDRE